MYSNCGHLTRFQRIPGVRGLTKRDISTALVLSVPSSGIIADCYLSSRTVNEPGNHILIKCEDSLFLLCCSQLHTCAKTAQASYQNTSRQHVLLQDMEIWRKSSGKRRNIDNACLTKWRNQKEGKKKREPTITSCLCRNEPVNRGHDPRVAIAARSAHPAVPPVGHGSTRGRGARKEPAFYRRAHVSILPILIPRWRSADAPRAFTHWLGPDGRSEREGGGSEASPLHSLFKNKRYCVSELAA